MENFRPSAAARTKKQRTQGIPPMLRRHVELQKYRMSLERIATLKRRDARRALGRRQIFRNPFRSPI